MAKIEEVLLSRTTISTFNALHSLLNAVGLEMDLESLHGMTLFAPPDEAFSALKQDTPYDLTRDITKLRQLLSFHIIPLRLTQADMFELFKPAAGAADQSGIVALETVSGYPLHLSQGARLSIEGARIIEGDIPADSGIIHIIDHILWPPGLNEASFKGQAPFKSSQPA
ncbi:fasciclin domain-containing protein [Dictyobacter arantiisoli]|uniref:FAS1 domain-containing protein n=1 Tax=Dictyobacter arantiisoli TaxID=2014874 RepID=A0A5A5TKZ2_9CHLR|nr:fasciclin domain-containing protein [Dictyobacter arantiisoli]GCF11928.1 hypothetical protein KDI_54920 [Dictyobacter arantiisoli]